MVDHVPTPLGATSHFIIVILIGCEIEIESQVH